MLPARQHPALLTHLRVHGCWLSGQHQRVGWTIKGSGEIRTLLARQEENLIRYTRASESMGAALGRESFGICAVALQN